MSIIFETSIGEFTVDLFCEERPKCCFNFLKLCKIKYYNYCLFHSIQERLVAQTGDPSGTGNGGYSIWHKLSGEKYFQNELKPKIKHYKAGLLSMVNNGSNMHGSQFCITLGDNLDYLDGKHTVFGEIVDGLEIINRLNEVFIDKNNVPLQDVRIYHTIIIDDPFKDPRNLVVPEKSPEPREEELYSKRVGAEEDLTLKTSATEEELLEIERCKESRTNAQILTIIGDIPDEDIAPPENVLFVCSLNPLTCSEDLELIFSRFGEILSCEVIRDQKTGSSLQYAFIEFKEKTCCEKAYFDMERVLIDDRRIHVDFSQSVSKQWQMHKNRYAKNYVKITENEKKSARTKSDSNDYKKYSLKNNERHYNENNVSQQDIRRGKKESSRRDYNLNLERNKDRSRDRSLNRRRSRSKVNDYHKKRRDHLRNSENGRRRRSRSKEIDNPRRKRDRD